MRTFLQFLSALKFKTPSYFKQHLFWMLLIAIVIVGSLLRITVFDTTGANFYHVDVARDYLMSSHIIMYGDLPLTGPDGYFGPNSNSPVYYYLIAGMLFLYDAILFPGLLNIVLQIAAIPVVYILGKELFGRKTGMGAAFLFAVCDGVVAQSMQMWQPHLMEFFLLLSYLCLARAYTRNSPSYLYVGMALLAFSAVLHTSVLAVVPVYIAVAVYLCKRKSMRFKQLLYAVGIFMVIGIAAYASVGYYFLTASESAGTQEAHELLYKPPTIPDPSIPDITVQTGERAVNLFTYFLEGSLQGPTMYTYVCMLLFGVSIAAYLVLSKNREQRSFFFICVCSIVLTCIAVGSLKLTEGGFPIRYYTPVSALLLLCIVECVFFVGKKIPHIWIAHMAVLMVIAYVGSEYVRSRFESFPQMIASQGIEIVTPKYVIPDDVIALSNIIREYSKDGELIDFDVRTVERDYEHLYKNELMWAPLELIFSKQLVHIDNATFRGYAVLKEPEHMFVRCLDTTTVLCAEVFMKKYATMFSIENIVYQSDGISYLYARKN